MVKMNQLAATFNTSMHKLPGARHTQIAQQEKALNSEWDHEGTDTTMLHRV